MIEPFWWIRSAGVAAVPVSNREPQVSRRDRPTRAAFFVLHFPGRLFERSGIFFHSFAGSFQGNATAELSPAPIEMVLFSGA